MDNNEPAAGRQRTGRRRGEVKGIQDEGVTKPWLLETDRLVMELKVKEFSRKLGSTGHQRVRAANHKAPHRDGPSTETQQSLLP